MFVLYILLDQMRRGLGWREEEGVAATLALMMFLSVAHFVRYLGNVGLMEGSTLWMLLDRYSEMNVVKDIEEGKN